MLGLLKSIINYLLPDQMTQTTEKKERTNPSLVKAGTKGAIVAPTSGKKEITKVNVMNLEHFTYEKLLGEGAFGKVRKCVQTKKSMSAPDHANSSTDDDSPK